MSETRDREPQPVAGPGERKPPQAGTDPAGPQPAVAASAAVRTDAETGEMWIQL